MKKMILVMFVMVMGIIGMRGERYYYQASGFSFNEGSGWSPIERSEVMMVLDTDDWCFFINSKSQQFFMLGDRTFNGYDNDGDYIQSYNFIDNENIRGELKFVRRNGMKRNEIYIVYRNLMLSYIVNRVE